MKAVDSFFLVLIIAVIAFMPGRWLNCSKDHNRIEELYQPNQGDKMTRSEVVTECKRIFNEQIDMSTDQFDANIPLASWGADSLDHVELIMAVEETFSIDVLDEDVEKFTLPSECVDLICKTLGVE